MSRLSVHLQDGQDIPGCSPVTPGVIADPFHAIECGIPLSPSLDGVEGDLVILGGHSGS